MTVLSASASRVNPISKLLWRELVIVSPTLIESVVTFVFIDPMAIAFRVFERNASTPVPIMMFDEPSNILGHALNPMSTDPLSLEFAAAAVPITTDCWGDPPAAAKLPRITDCRVPGLSLLLLPPVLLVPPPAKGPIATFEFTFDPEYMAYAPMATLKLPSCSAYPDL